MAQSVVHLTLDLSSALGLGVMGSGPRTGVSLGTEPTLKKIHEKYEEYFQILNLGF